ncbi:MAG: cytochrome P450, partial [Acidimicrobiales bacterium]
MPTPAAELDIPEVEVLGVDRAEAIAILRAAAEKHWLARTPLGYAVTRYEDVTAVLRDKRWHSGVALLPQLAGIDDEAFADRRQRSILAMEGDEHARLRRLVSRAFTPRSADRLRPFMRQVITDLADPVSDAGHCELVG